MSAISHKTMLSPSPLSAELIFNTDTLFTQFGNGSQVQCSQLTYFFYTAGEAQSIATHTTVYLLCCETFHAMRNKETAFHPRTTCLLRNFLQKPYLQGRWVMEVMLSPSVVPLPPPLDRDTAKSCFCDREQLQKQMASL